MVSKKALLTIIMPVRNAEKHILKALENIATQSFKNYELLLIDALSTDATRNLIELNQAINPRIHFVSEKDKGIYDAMNKGIALAQGEWLYFMGCDDAFYDPEVLTRVSNYLTNEVDLVYGNSIWVPGEEREEGEWELKQLLHRNVNHQRIFYRKTLFEKWGSYDLQYLVAADQELNIRFFCNKHIRKRHIPVIIARYHAFGFSANKFDEVFWNNWKRIFIQNFGVYLPKREMYNKLGWYCRYQMDQRNFAKSFRLFWDVFSHTLSPGFVLLTVRHFIQTQRKHAG